MSDETGNGDSVLHSVSGCYAEVHISWEITENGLHELVTKGTCSTGN